MRYIYFSWIKENLGKIAVAEMAKCMYYYKCISTLVK